MTKRRPGRPRIPKSQHVVGVTCYVAPETHAALVGAAQACGLRVGPYVADLLRVHAKAVNP